VRESATQEDLDRGARIGAQPGGVRAREVEGTLAGVLARAIGAIAEQSGASRVAAWGRTPDGALAVLAARTEGATLATPREASWAALAALHGPTDLLASADPALRALAEEHGFVAAAPLEAAASEPLAVLLVAGGGERDARPRLLAALGAAVARSSAPASAFATAERIAHLDCEMQRLDRLAAVGGLLAEIVHEIRNPLVSIKTFLHLLGEEAAAKGSEPQAGEGGSLSSEAKPSEAARGDEARGASAPVPRSEAKPSEDESWPADFREVAIEELRRIERLLELVSQHARPPAGASAEALAEVEPAIRSVAQLATLRAVDRGVAIEVDLPPALAPVRIAGDALRQILLNLALNAIEATPEGAAVRIRAAEQGDEIVIEVDDEGPGVPEAVRARLFEPFFSTKSRSGGLGLAITRRLVEDAGGAIEVAGRAPTGTRFRVTLPLARS